jgi:predicted nucleotidyltransferase
MSKPIDLERLRKALEPVPGLRFAVLFGSAKDGQLAKPDSDVDIAVKLDHPVDVDARASLIGVIQDALGTDRVDLVLIQESDHWVLHREIIRGRLLVCHDPEAYASFFSLADRRGRDEEARIARAWALRRDLVDTSKGSSPS